MAPTDKRSTVQGRLLVRVRTWRGRRRAGLRQLRLAIQAEHHQQRLLSRRLNPAGLSRALHAAAATHERDVLLPIDHEGDWRPEARAESRCFVIKELLALVGGVRDKAP